MSAGMFIQNFTKLEIYLKWNEPKPVIPERKPKCWITPPNAKSNRRGDVEISYKLLNNCKLDKHI